MKDAKSMYRGGDIVEAGHCDFDSAKLLGLVCPFCNEAVYLRTGTSRMGKSKISLVNPSFCHYPGSAEDLDCERRSIGGEGRREIERIKAEKRGQRLELYNKHLWDMIRTKYNTLQFDAEAFVGLELMEKKHKDWFFCRVARSWKIESLEEPTAKNVVDFIFDSFCNCDVSDFASEKNMSLEAANHDYKIAKELQVLCNYDHGYFYHKTICCEVLMFLKAKTSGFVFRNIIKKVLSDLICFKRSFLERGDENELIPYVFKCVVGILIQVPWEAQIERFFNPDRKAADEKYYALLEQAKRAANVPSP
jgi:hypothetical protein